MANLNFQICHQIANYHFHHQNKRSFSHNVYCSHFIMWIYYNDDPTDELKIILRLCDDHQLEKGSLDENIE